MTEGRKEREVLRKIGLKELGGRIKKVLGKNRLRTGTRDLAGGGGGGAKKLERYSLHKSSKLSEFYGGAKTRRRWTDAAEAA